MLWRNAVPFNKNDEYFHKDIGFYVFDYPWYRYLLSFGFTVLVFSIIGGRRHPLPVRRHQAAGQAQPGDERSRRSTCRCCSGSSCH